MAFSCGGNHARTEEKERFKNCVLFDATAEEDAVQLTMKDVPAYGLCRR